VTGGRDPRTGPAPDGGGHGFGVAAMPGTVGSQGRMRVVVDLNRCQGYAQCCYAAPAHFELRGHEILFYDTAPPMAARGAIERAVLACPVRAISLQAAAHEPGDAP
jgi:ferredoxin